VETRMRGFGAEVDRAICPSTVTNSGPLREPADKHSIYLDKYLSEARFRVVWEEVYQYIRELYQLVGA
jgi:hypothetical protein